MAMWRNLLMAGILAFGLGAAEMLQNPELTGEGKAPTSWQFKDWGTGSEPLFAGEGLAGIACADRKDRGCWAQMVPLEGRRHLHLAVRYRTEAALQGSGALVRLAWRDGERKFLANTRLAFPLAGEWTEAVEWVTAVPGAEFVEVELFNEFRPGRVWWDFARLRETTAAELLRFDERPAGDEEWGFRPAEGETPDANPPAFVWRPQRGAVRYTLEVAREADFARIVYEAEIPEFTAHCPPRLFEPGEHWWRVRFANAEGGISPWCSSRRFTVTAEAPAFPLPDRAALFARVPAGHPRLFLRPEELPRLRELAQGPLRENYAALVARCDRLLAAPLPTGDYTKYPEGMKTLSAEWGKMWRGARPYVERPLDGAADLALVWLLGGDEKYGQAARRLLLEVAEWDPVGATGYRYNDEAGMRYAYGFSRAYTLIHGLLTEAERERCRAVMRIRGQEMYDHLHKQRWHLWNPYSSHPNRAYHFLGEIGLAFHGEIPEAEDWAWFAVNVFQNVYPVWNDADGGWHEGVGYWQGYMILVTWWIDIMRATLDHDGYRKPFFSRAGLFPIYAQPPNVPRICFGDTTGVRRPAEVRALLTQFVQATGNPYWADYLERLGGPVSARDAVGFIRAARSLDRPPVEPQSIAKLPPSRLFAGTGLAYLHTDLTDSRRDVQVSFKSSPFGSVSHGNEAQNSFELYAYGDALLARSGTREIHGSEHHRNWTWQTHSCNAVTLDGRGQIPHSAAARGRIRDFVSVAGFDYVVGDAAEAYPTARADRHLVFAKPDLLVVFDDLETAVPGPVQLHLHSPYAIAATTGEHPELRVVG
ncbi:MAG: DUF4962 domain-containing protein, partial [Lentisphaeria bacterium]|nr:DUF4962 domain-containing protein [Lentisphaeria bacterium]